MTLAKAKENLDTKNTLPHGWNWVLLEDLFDVKQGAAMSPVRRQGIAPRPFLRTLNVLWGSVDLSNLDKMDFSENEVASLNLRSGDLLVCEGGDVGRTAIWKGELDSCLYQNHIHRLRRRHNNVAPEFYAYWMQAAFKVFQSYKGKEITTTIPNLSGGKLKSFMVPLPPTLAEQERIARILNERMTAVEKARVAADVRIEAAKALPAAYLRAVFESEEAKEWPKKRLSKVCTEIYRYPSFYGFEHLNSGVPVIRGEHINSVGEITTDWKQYWFVSDEISKQFPRTILHEGDIVFTVRGTIGKVGIVRSKHSGAQLSPNLIRISPSPETIDSAFLWYFLTMLKGTDDAVVNNAVTVATVKASDLVELRIPLPTKITEQKHIVSKLNEQMAATKEVCAAIETELKAINTLPAALLRRAFTGGL